ncbi:MAG: hypothetical protein GY820_18840 [Gammaproteobacteria bacterium]|nr:hypothetical protein [Gammaproteobacteria bacterium]
MNILIDTKYDFQSEVSKNSDPDRYSPTLRKYHKILWSKRLPNGEDFKLKDTYPKGYLYHQSNLGEFKLSSDAITHSYKNTKRMSHIIEKIPTEKIEKIYNQGCTIGSYIIFPKNKIKNQHSINQARGCNHKIADRFDLTLECIRLFYDDTESPLTPVFQRHSDFFNLFVNFKGYVDFFLLRDLVAKDYSSIKYHLAHQDFEVKPLPQDVDEYLEYWQNTLNFIKARNKRMLNSIDGELDE